MILVNVSGRTFMPRVVEVTARILVSCLCPREGLPQGPPACKSFLTVYATGLLSCFLSLRSGFLRCTR